MEEQITERAKRAIKEKVFPGCVVGFVRKNGERVILPFGHSTYEEESSLIKDDSIYDVASITKSIPTGSLALMLIDQGKLSLTDKLSTYVPEFRNSDRDAVLIKHLLTYSLDGYGLALLRDSSAEELFEHLMTQDFVERPGSIFKYTNIPAFLLGLVVESILGKPLDVLGDEHFFAPLDMKRTTFHPDVFSKDEIAPTEIDYRGLVHGVVHDESAHTFRTKGNRVSGHAGLFSTVPDLLQFMEMILNNGTFKGKTYFSENIVKEMGTNQIENLGLYMGLGWELYQPRYMGQYATEHTFGKTGFTGTVCICDIPREVAYVILSNRTYPERSPDSVAINAFRADIGDIIFESL